MIDKKARMVEMHLQGMSYAEIGRIMGISRQRVFQLIGGIGKRHRPITGKECVYVGIRNWLNENEISLNSLVRLIYGELHPSRYESLKKVLKGADCNKHYIDDILRITGLTYEEAFKKDM